MAGPLSRAWEVCRALDKIDDAERQRDLWRAVGTTGPTRPNPYRATGPDGFRPPT